MTALVVLGLGVPWLALLFWLGRGHQRRPLVERLLWATISVIAFAQVVISVRSGDALGATFAGALLALAARQGLDYLDQPVMRGHEERL